MFIAAAAAFLGLIAAGRFSAAFAVALSAWAAVRWVGFVAGGLRVQRLPKGPVRREARRAVISSGAITVWLSVAGLLAWTWAIDLQVTESFGGFLAAALMVSLAVGVASTLMQPEERTPETLDLCRLRRRRKPRPVHGPAALADIEGTEGPED